MKVNNTTNILAFVMTMIHIIAIGLLFGLNIINVPINSTIYYVFLFFSETSYIIVLLYLVAVLRKWTTTATVLPYALFMFLELATFLGSLLLSPNAETQKILAGFSMAFFVIETYMVIITLRTKFKELAIPFRGFAITVLLCHLIKISIPLVILTYFHDKFNPATVKFMLLYSNLLYLLPSFAIFFILQKTSLLLSGNVKPALK
ncbi:hypothetical protein GCM10023149_17590 [Mucilaginibacter gynuensis]|uniref:Integral membrane protein n=1 Tax=Mucilaginibacter gynuensis TaxID=1302236 RepID=A0ABP8G7W9_9SPHI